MAGFTPEEAAAIKQQEVEDILRFGKASDETRKQLIDLAVGVKGTTEAMTAHMKSFGTTGVGLIKDLNAGRTGATVFNNTIGTTANALGDLAGTIPYVGKALKTVIKAGGEYAQAVNTQAEALMSSYRTLGALGAATAGGIEDVYANLKNLNLGATEADLQKLNSIVRENAQTLASFGTTVGSGVKEFANITRAIHDDMGPAFREMGISIEEINAGAMSYIKIQNMMGGRQKMTTEEQIAATQNYIREVDQLTKMTGKTRAEQESAMETAMQEEKFAALRYELKQREQMGTDAEKAAAKAQGETLDQLNNLFDKTMPGLRKGVISMASGTMNTKESADLSRLAPEAAAMLMNFKNKPASTDQIVGAINKGLKSAYAVNADGSTGAGLQAASVGAGGYIGNTAENLKGIALTSTSVVERLAESAKNQEITNKATKDQTKGETELLKSRDKLNDVVNAGIGPMSAGFAKLAGATDTAVESMTKLAAAAGITVSKRNVAPPPAPAPVPPPAPAPVPPPAPAPVPLRPAGGAGGGGARTAAPPAAPKPAAPPVAASKLTPQQTALAQSAGFATNNQQAAEMASKNLSAVLTGGTDGQGAEKTGSNNAAPPASKAAKLKAPGKGSSMAEEDIKKMIINHEGMRNRPYKDSLGLWTVGVGHLIGDGKSLPKEWDREFSQEEIMKMFNDDYAHHRMAAQNIPGFSKLDTSGQGALTDLTFNMGPSWIQKWPKLKEQLANADLAGAASNLESSKWYAQVKSRGPTVVDLLKNSQIMAENGGVARGPNSGYPATLHGDEAIIPLNNGAGDFVKMFEDMANSNREMAGLMQEMVRAQKSSVDVQYKILKSA